MEDDLWLSVVANNDGKLPELFDSLFSFLRRRTDFYVINDVEGEPGLPRGMAERMILGAFDKHAALYCKFKNQEKQEGRKAEAAPRPANMSLPQLPSFEPRQPSISTGNGGSEPDGLYHWSQSAADLIVEFPIDEVVPSKDCLVQIGNEFVHIRVPRVGLAVKRSWWGKIAASDCTWCLDTRRDSEYVQRQSLTIYVMKDSEGWWDWPFAEDVPEDWRGPEYTVPKTVALSDVPADLQVSGGKRASDGVFQRQISEAILKR